MATPLISSQFTAESQLTDFAGDEKESSEVR
jgi:hypothetical protein